MIDEIRYRWETGSPSLPGALKAYRLKDGTEVRIVGLFSDPDKEASMWRRRVRAILFGRGQGFTLWGAFYDAVLWYPHQALKLSWGVIRLLWRLVP